MNNQNINFINQDLRNLSFKGKNLDGANFSKADIRGCDFGNTSLRGANFQNVKAGQTTRIFLFLICIVFLITIIAFHAVSQMIFGVIARTPESPIWSYAVALSISLGISGIVCAINSLAPKKSILQRICSIISAALSGAILGFFYGGTAAGGKNPQIAITSAVIGALIMAIANYSFKQELIQIICSVAGTITTYGFAFLIGARAINFLMTQNMMWGVILSILSLTYIGLTIISLKYTIKKITTYSVTSFRNSDLTDANFDNAKLGFSDFTGAVRKVEA